MLDILINILLVVHVAVSVLLILVTLMQRPKNEGLGAAFGGGMTDNLFGAQTTDTLQKVTRWLGGLFLALTLVLSFLYAKKARTTSAASDKLLNIPVPAASATPFPAASPAADAQASPEAPATAATPAAESTPGPVTEAPAAVEPAAPAASATPATP